MRNAVNLRVERHDLQEAVSAAAHPRLAPLLFVGFFAPEHAAELTAALLELGLPAGLASDLLAARVLNGLPRLEVETP